MVEKIYKIYVSKCKDVSSPAISLDEFKNIWVKGRQVLIHLIERNKGGEPYIVTEIDDKFVMYQEINKDKIVTNIWDKDQYTLLTPRGIKYGK